MQKPRGSFGMLLPVGKQGAQVAEKGFGFGVRIAVGDGFLDGVLQLDILGLADAFGEDPVKVGRLNQLHQVVRVVAAVVVGVVFNHRGSEDIGLEIGDIPPIDI